MIYKIIIKGTATIIGRITSDCPKNAIAEYKKQYPEFEPKIIAKKEKE